MLTRGLDRRTVYTVLLAAVLLASGLGTAIGAAPAGAAGEGAAANGGGASESATVHPDLRDTEGEVTVVVRFPGLGNDRARAQSRRDKGMEMRSHATDTQAAFDGFVADRPAVRVDRSFWVANAKLVTVDTDRVDLKELAAVDGVREIHPNYRVGTSAGTATAPAATAPTTSTPEATVATAQPATDGTTDNGFQTTYGLEQIRVPEVWERFDTRGAGVSVAVLDTGVDPDHPDLNVTEARWAEFDDEGERVGSTPYDSATHGTHTSGTVAGGNASGTAIGVAPDATLYHGKVLDEGNGTWASAIAGIEWAATEAEVDVISMSLGGETYHPGFVEPIQRANRLGVIVVASAGNTEVGSSNSPGNLYDTISVGAVDANRDVAAFSSGERIDTVRDWGTDAPGDWPDEYVVPGVSAPGVNVWSAERGGGYGYMGGTSMAAPHVAGTVALIRAAGGDNLTQAEMRDLLQRTASKPAGEPEAPNVRYGAGVIDAYEATVHGTADSTVTGRVADESDDPVIDGRVDTEFDYGTATDGDGTYALDVPPIEQTLTVEAFGFDSQTFVVSPDGGTHERNFELTEPTLAAREAVGPDQRVDPGETVTHEFAVSNVSSVTVEQRNGMAMARGGVTLRIDGQEMEFGEERTYDEPVVNGNVTVEVETSDETLATLELDHTFSDGTATATRTTNRTHVHPDPFRVPTEYDLVDLQSAVDVAAPGTTLVVDERETGGYVLPINESAAADSGLSIDDPMTLRAAEGETPVFVVADHDADATDVVGVDASAPGVELRGITIDANGADVGVRTGDDTTVEATTVSNATVALDVGEGFVGHGLDLGDGRPVDVDASNVAVSPVDAPAPAPEHHERVGPAVAVESTGSPSSATLSVAYDAADLTRVRNESLRLWRYDEVNGAWTPIDRSAADESSQRIDGTLDSPGTIAPMGEEFSAGFVVERVEVPQDVVAGETLTVNATVSNFGASGSERTVELRVDGERVAQETVHLDAGAETTVDFSYTPDAAGTVELVVASPDDAGSTSIDVAPEESDDRDSSGSTGSGGGSSGTSGGGGGSVGGGGGGGGGAPAAPAPPPAEEEDSTNETADDVPAGVLAETADIVDAAPERPGVSVPFRNATVSEITFGDDDATGTLTVREGVTDDLPAPPGSTLAQLEIGVPAALADRPATITTVVDPTVAGDDDLTMYRHAEGEWQALETTVRTVDAELVVEAETPGFSRFALVRSAPESTPTPTETRSDGETTATVTATTTPGSSTTEGSSSTDETDATSPTEDDGAGFGVVAGLVAALVGLLATRRATR